jgi:hypothetical protein
LQMVEVMTGSGPNSWLTPTKIPIVILDKYAFRVTRGFQVLKRLLWLCFTKRFSELPCQI